MKPPRNLKGIMIAIMTFLVAASPISAYASTLGEQDYQDKMPSRASNPVELMNYRTTNSQTFMNSNGTFTTKIFPTDVFFRDNSGNWQTIDNSLVSDGNGGFQNKLGPYNVDFPSTLANSGAITISANPKDKLTMTLGGATETQSETTSGKTITYPGVESGDNISYVAQAHQVKESITLDSASANNTFSFTLHAPNITFTKQSDGSITGTVSGTHHTVFTIPAPFMTDANGVRSSAVTTALSTNSNGDTVITMTADSSWLNDPSRAFPVVIDPSVGVTPNSQTGVDTSISSVNTSASYYTDPHLYVGYAGSSYGYMRSLLRFDNLPNLLPGGTGTTITNATLYLYQDSTGENGMPIQAFPITSTWQPSTVSWSGQPSVGSSLDTESQATSNISQTSPYVGTWSFNVTSAMQSVYNAQQSNFGFELRAQTESTSDPEATFASSDNTTEPLPSLSVTYTVNPIGSDNSWMSSSDGVNYAGGNLSLPQSDLSISGRGPEVAITRTFNSKNQSVNEGFGNGWSSNILMHLTMDLPGPILFTDASGLVHELVPVANNSGIWVDSGNEHEFLIQNSNGTYTLYQSDGTQLVFWGSGKLYEIQTEAQNGNNMQTETFVYNASSQLSTITDASGRVWNVTYNGAGNISQITDPDTRSAVYSYDANNNLTGVTINPPSGSTGDVASTTSYAYNSTAPQFVVTDPDGNQTKYTWNSSDQITSVADTVEGTAATTPYTWGTVSSGSNAGDSEVTVTDPTGHAVEYVTNANGNVVQTIVDPTGLAYTTNYTWDQNDDITGVTDPNGHTVSSVYNSNGDLVQFTDGNKAVSNFAFDSLDNPKGSNDNNGSTSHSSYNGTLATDSVDQAGNDTMVTYDANGNPITVTGPEGLGNNLVPNSDFAHKDSTTGLPVDWTNSSGSGISIDTNAADAAVGSTSLEISSTAAAGDQMNVNIPVTAGETYNLSAFIKTSNVTAASGYGAGISAHWYNSSGTDIQDNTGYINTVGTIDWTRKYGQLTAPSGAASLQLQCNLYGSGTAWFDGVQVEPVAYTPNLLLNSSFGDNTSGSVLPDNWDTSQLVGSDGLQNSTTYNGLPSLLVNGNGGSKSFSQTVSGPQYPVDGFLLSASSKQSGASANYTVTATVNYTDGTNTSNDITFLSSSTEWQTPQPAFVPVTSGKTIKNIVVTADFSNQPGGSSPAQAWFNDIELKAMPLTSSFSAYNYVLNPGFLFDYQGNALPDDWTDLATDTGTPSWNSIESYDGDGHSLQIHPSTNTSATEEVANDGLAPYQTGANYTAVGYIHTEGLASDSAYIAIQALDANGNVLGTYDSNKVGHSTADANGNVDWTHVIVNVPASSLPAGTANVRVVLCQNGDTNGGSGSGNSYFDDIRLSTTDLSTHYTYDSKGNYVTSVTDAMGNTTTMTPDPNTGFDTSVTDPLNNKTSFMVNKFEETTSTTLPTGDVFNYSYDANGNLTKVTGANGASVSYAYNELGQVKTFTETVNGTYEVTGIHHNGDGQVTEIDSPNTTTTDIGYNNANDPTSVSYYNSGGKQDQWNFGYDGVGNLTSMQDQSATSPTTYGHDANNNLTSVTEPVSGGSNTESLTLDPNGNPTTVTYQLGSSTGPTWSLYNAFDIAGNLRSVNDNNKQTTTYEYDDHGNLVKTFDNATGQAEFYSYNPDQQVFHVTFKGNSTTGNTNDLSYLYDADGRIKSITDNTTGETITFLYNSIGELTQETTWDGRTITYTYDNVGNRTSMSVTQNGTITTTNYGYDNEKNRLTSITVGSNPAQSVTYDGMGNTLSDGTNTYTWNAANELSSVTVPGGTVYNYTYDGLGRRVTAYGNTYHYNGQSDQIAYITDANNNLVARFSYGANGPAYMTLASGKVYRYVYDGQGDVIGLVDVTSGSSTFGQEVVTYSYDAWGNIISKTDTSGANASTINPFTYRGYVYDSQTGLYYLNARYYNPVTGRFLSQDQVAPNASNPLSINQYVYCENNPVNKVDPTGNFSIPLGFGTYISLSGSWWNWHVGVNITWGFIGAEAVGILGGAALAPIFEELIVSRVVEYIGSRWLADFLANGIGRYMAKRVRNNLAKIPYKLIERGNHLLYKRAFGFSFRI